MRSDGPHELAAERILSAVEGGSCHGFELLRVNGKVPTGFLKRGEDEEVIIIVLGKPGKRVNVHYKRLTHFCRLATAPPLMDHWYHHTPPPLSRLAYPVYSHSWSSQPLTIDMEKP